VKRIAGGRASTHLVESARAGDCFDVLGPSGSFTLDAAPDSPLVLIAGGSGITPIASILGEALRAGREVALLYANRSAEDVIFARELTRAAGEHVGFAVTHLFGPTLDVAALASALDGIAFASEADYFVCGPEAMMRRVREALFARAIAAERIHEERFLSPQARAQGAAERRSDAGPPVRVTVRAAGSAYDVRVPRGSSLLEAGLAARAPMPFSCGLGGCGACRVKVCSGSVEMDAASCLTDDERAQGYALACIGVPSDGAIVEVA
jgi:ferredoxin-NADP reductase